MFEYVSFSFSPFRTIRKISRLDGLQGFLHYFSALLFSLISLDLIDGSSFFIITGLAHRDLKPASIILVGNKHYTNITDVAELNICL